MDSSGAQAESTSMASTKAPKARIIAKDPGILPLRTVIRRPPAIFDP
jgi:hypothetical protein